MRIPPTTTIASGRCTSEPIPELNTIGRNPKAATSAVIKMGRSRALQDSMAASKLEWLVAEVVMNSTSTMQLRTEIPIKAIKPTSADTLMSD